MDRNTELFSRATAGGLGPKGARAALAGFALLVLGAAWYSTVAASPYTGTPVPIPGTFQAENFDRGGEGIGYHDTTAGNTGTHSPSLVINDRVVRGAGAPAGRPDTVNGVPTQVGGF